MMKSICGISQELDRPNRKVIIIITGNSSPLLRAFSTGCLSGLCPRDESLGFETVLPSGALGAMETMLTLEAPDALKICSL